MVCGTGKIEQKRKAGTAAPPTHADRSEKMKYKSRDASTCLGARQISVKSDHCLQLLGTGQVAMFHGRKQVP